MISRQFISINIFLTMLIVLLSSSAIAITDNGMIARFEFEDNLTDTGPNGWDMIGGGTYSFTTIGCHEGKCVNFSGSGWLNRTGINFGTSATIAIWAYSPNAASDQTMLSMDDRTGAQHKAFQMQYEAVAGGDPTNLYFWDESSGGYHGSADSLGATQISLYVMTVDGSTVVNYFNDTVLVTDYGTGIIAVDDWSGEFIVGAYQPTKDRKWYGVIDSVSVWNYTMSQANVTDLFLNGINASVAIPPAPLNITLFAPDQNLHYNTDLVAVFNTTNINNATCSLSVGGFVKDTIVSVNSSESNYTLTWSPVTDGNNSWRIDCIEQGTSIAATPNSVEVVTGVQHGNASNLTAQDGSLLHIEEVNGVPGFEVRMNWTAQLDEPEFGNFFQDYDGSPSHEVMIQGWNGTAWEGQGNYSDEGGFFWLNFSAISPSSRFVVDGQVSVRLYHQSSGNQNHNLFIDYAELVFVLSSSSTQSDTWYYFVDVTDPSINFVTPIDGVNISDENYTVDVRVSDMFLSEAEANLSCGFTTYFYNKSTGLSETKNFTGSALFGLLDTNCQMNVTASDDHTKNAISVYEYNSLNDKVEFITDLQHNIDIRSVGPVSVKTEVSKFVDRYKFEFQYSTEVSTASYRVSSNFPLYYNDRYDYPAFWTKEPGSFEGHWIDFNAQDIERYEVSRTSDYNWLVDIYFSKPTQNIEFNSVGGLNVISAMVFFSVDTIPPVINSTSPLDGSVFSITFGGSLPFSFNASDNHPDYAEFWNNFTGVWRNTENVTWSNFSTPNSDFTFSASGNYSYGFNVFDSYGNNNWTDNSTIDITINTINITSIFNNDCPDDSLAESFMYLVMFIILITFYLLSRFIIKIPVIEVFIGLATAFFSIPLMSCDAFLGGVGIFIGIGMMAAAASSPPRKY